MITEVKNQAIGVFDSGVGGLTVLKEIVKLLPNEEIVYFGDTARVPYGEKRPETIITYSIENALFLMQHEIKVLVVACNTASAFAIHKLSHLFHIPVIGVIEPGAKKAVSATKNGRIAVLGTRGTIQSGAYQQEIQKRRVDSFVLPISCPLLVPLVEERYLSHPATKMIIKEYLAPIKDHGIDTVLLGCTHYPLLQELIQEEVGDHVTVVDSATLLAENLKSVLFEKELENLSGKSTCRYFVSDDPEKFSLLATSLFNEPIGNVIKYTH